MEGIVLLRDFFDSLDVFDRVGVTGEVSAASLFKAIGTREVDGVRGEAAQGPFLCQAPM